MRSPIAQQGFEQPHYIVTDLLRVKQLERAPPQLRPDLEDAFARLRREFPRPRA